MRRGHLPADAFYGPQSLNNPVDSLILECSGTGVLHHYWPFCVFALLSGAGRHRGFLGRSESSHGADSPV
eukprot:6407225-Pyramimonas_sp.AAC.1